MAHHEHRKHGPAAIRCAVVTVSDTRTEETDSSGAAIRELLAGAGHEVVRYAIVPDEPERIRALIGEIRAAGAARAVIVNGGTGISRRDRTFEAVSALLDKKLDGFGELFRSLSYAEIGSAAMLSRAVAGLSGELVIFSVPGSSAAVRLAMEKLILPELGHVVGEAAKG